MKQTIINKLSVFSNENPTLLGSIATNKQIENAQKILRVTMNEDYTILQSHNACKYSSSQEL